VRQPAADEQTRIYATPVPQPRPAQVPVPSVYTPTPHAPAQMPPQQHAPAAHPQHAPQHPQYADAAMQAQPPVRSNGPVKRFFRALWEFTVTTAAVAMFVGAWWVAVAGAVEDRRAWLYAGAAATVFCTPFALHRLTSRRGRLGFGIIASLGATALAWRLAGRGEIDPAIGLAALFGLQVIACFLMSWLTRRRERHPQATS
jgi:hypothetical protein